MDIAGRLFSIQQEIQTVENEKLFGHDFLVQIFPLKEEREQPLPRHTLTVDLKITKTKVDLLQTPGDESSKDFFRGRLSGSDRPGWIFHNLDCQSLPLFLPLDVKAWRSSRDSRFSRFMAQRKNPQGCEKLFPPRRRQSVLNLVPAQAARTTNNWYSPMGSGAKMSKTQKVLIVARPKGEERKGKDTKRRPQAKEIPKVHDAKSKGVACPPLVETSRLRTVLRSTGKPIEKKVGTELDNCRYCAPNPLKAIEDSCLHSEGNCILGHFSGKHEAFAHIMVRYKTSQHPYLESNFPYVITRCRETCEH
ncbi:serine--tRNA ligase [Striga asiatica]|uniref:Serine--tRNA ligase n=1 Tax=Striga asiatica TaxID=4170 RepID=A0A5A7QLC6_STRAF|nr:serine--tRNA ligase [Striga asiatica]